MTTEEFRSRLNNGPTVEELTKGFETRIIDLANRAINERTDISEMKKRISALEDAVKKLQSVINDSNSHDDVPKL